MNILQGIAPADGEPDADEEEGAAQAEDYGPRVVIDRDEGAARAAEAGQVARTAQALRAAMVLDLVHRAEERAVGAADEAHAVLEGAEAVGAGLGGCHDTCLDGEGAGVSVGAGDCKLGQARGVHPRVLGRIEVEEGMEDVFAQVGRNVGGGRQAAESDEIGADDEGNGLGLKEGRDPHPIVQVVLELRVVEEQLTHLLRIMIFQPAAADDADVDVSGKDILELAGKVDLVEDDLDGDIQYPQSRREKQGLYGTELSTSRIFERKIRCFAKPEKDQPTYAGHVRRASDKERSENLK